MPEQDYINALQPPEDDPNEDSQAAFRERVLQAASELLPPNTRIKLEAVLPDEPEQSKAKPSKPSPSKPVGAGVVWPPVPSGAEQLDEEDPDDEDWGSRSNKTSSLRKAFRVGAPVIALTLALGTGYVVGTRGGDHGGSSPQATGMSAAEQAKLRAFHPQALACSKPVAKLAMSTAASLNFTYAGLDGQKHKLVYQEAPSPDASSSAGATPAPNTTSGTTPVAETHTPAVKTTYEADVTACATAKKLESALAIDSKKGTVTVDLAKLPPSVAINGLHEETTPALTLFPNLQIQNSTGYDPDSVNAMNKTVADFAADLSVTRSQTFNGLRSEALTDVDKNKITDTACHDANNSAVEKEVVAEITNQLKAAQIPNAKVVVKGSTSSLQASYAAGAHIPDSLGALPKNSPLTLDGVDVKCTVAK